MAEDDNSVENNAAAGPQGRGEAVPVSRGKTEEKSCKCKCQQNHYFSQKTKDFISLGTLIAVCVYTGITIALWCNGTQQLKVSRDTEIRQLRAYVVVDSLTAILAATGIPTEITYLPNNIGQTPAANVQFFGRAFLAKSRLEAFDLPPLDTDSVNQGSGILNPSAQFKDSALSYVRVRPEITQEQWEAAAKFITSRLIAFGEVTYKDVFNINRHTWWCQMAGGHSITGGPNAGKVSLIAPWEPCLTQPGPGKLPPNRFD
jgi:hypothetical protein